MVSISPNQSTLAQPAARAQRTADVANKRRWSGRKTLAFVVGASTLGWLAIGFAVFTAIKR